MFLNYRIFPLGMVKKNMSSTLTAKAVIRILESHKAELRQFGVKKIGLFGSYLKGAQHKKSDLDLLVTFTKPTYDNFIELKFFLENVFRRKVDLVLERSLKPALQYVKEETLYAEV